MSVVLPFWESGPDLASGFIRPELPRRVLLLGKLGQVGWELHRSLWLLGEVLAVDYPDVDLARPETLTRVVLDTRPDIIVNAAAYTAVDRAETEPDLAMQVNGVAPGVLAETARDIGAWLVHFSTDYVFSGTKREPYLETDEPEPLGAYARSKWAGDQAVLQSGCRHLIFRLCWVYGNRGTNFLRTIIRLAAEHDTLRVVNDQTGTPTWSRMIALCVTAALMRVVSATDPDRYVGVYNLAAEGATTWYEFARAIVALLPPERVRCKTIEPITSDQYPSHVRRPAYSVLSCKKFDSTFGVRRLHWLDALRLVMQED